MPRGPARIRGGTDPRRRDPDGWEALPDLRMPPPRPGPRLLVVGGRRTGPLRRLVQGIALLLWAPVGFVVWVPFLLRRTVAYVLALLYAGLTGGEADAAERRWEQAVAFYPLGFRRIVGSLRGGGDGVGADGDAAVGAGDGETAEPAAGGRAGRMAAELAWAAVVWVAALWLTGLWPEAPEALRSSALGALDAVVGAALRFDAWVQGLVR